MGERMTEKRLDELRKRIGNGLNPWHADGEYLLSVIDAQAERIHERYLEGIKDGSRRSSTRITEQTERIKELEGKPPWETTEACAEALREQLAARAEDAERIKTLEADRYFMSAGLAQQDVLVTIARNEGIDEARRETATAIARGMGELAPYGARETYKQAIKDALEVCRAHGGDIPREAT